MTKQIRAFAPASVGNLNVGFDILGLAYSSIGDHVTLTPNGTKENRITSITGAEGLPLDIAKNCSSVVIRAIQEATDTDLGVDIEIEKGFRPGSGLGSSAASSAAAAVAYNELIGAPLTKHELIPFAAEGERIACGTPILDNVSSALLGGLVLMHEGVAIQLPLPKGLYAVSLFPQIEVKTSDARRALPNDIPLKTVTHQTSHVASFVSALYENDIERLRASFCDLLAQPYRRQLIPHFDELERLATTHKAIGFGISGSGPSTFAIVASERAAIDLQRDFISFFDETSIETLSFVECLDHNRRGTYIRYDA